MPAIDVIAHTGEFDLQIGEWSSRGWRWEDIFSRLAIEAKPKPSGKYQIHCVFHEERTPSLRLWPGGTFHCHGCLTKGHAVDFVLAILKGEGAPLDYVRYVGNRRRALSHAEEVSIYDEYLLREFFGGSHIHPDQLVLDEIQQPGA